MLISGYFSGYKRPHFRVKDIEWREDDGEDDEEKLIERLRQQRQQLVQVFFFWKMLVFYPSMMRKVCF